MTPVAPPGTSASESNSLPHLLTTAEAAEVLRLSIKTVLRRIESGKLPAIREGGRWLVDAEAIRTVLIAGLRRFAATPAPKNAA